MSELTNGDKRSIAYFLEKNGDLTNWVELEDKIDAIIQEFPSLVEALGNRRNAEVLLKLEVEKLKDSIDD